MKRLFFIIFLPVIAVGAMWSQGQSEGMRKLSLADFAITNLYVDEVDENKLVEDAIRGMLDKLDPHSTYTTAEETREMNEPLQGNFSGVGIQFNMNKDTLYVIQTIVGGPSEKVGILAGDRIIAVNDTTIAGVKMKNTDIMKRLRGESGTVVRVTVLRKGVKEPIEFRIVRDKIPIYSIDASYMADKETGYIRVSRFAVTTDKEFSDVIKEKGKLVLLVDESSASASEILSGAIQDWDRGIIVGRRTFGKGLVQRPIPFPDGSMIRLTVARYYTPSGRSIQKPYDKGHEAYERELLDRFNHGELIYTDSIHFPDSLQFQTLKSKRTVYGGGGIMPDIFIPLDTTIYTDFHRDLLAKGVLNQYPVNYLDSHRKELMNKYKKVDQFVEEFAVTDDMLAELLKMGETEKVKYNEEQYRKSKGLIALQIKALIARDMFDTAAYFRVMNPRNPSFVKAMEIINDDLEYNRLLQPKP